MICEAEVVFLRPGFCEVLRLGIHVLLRTQYNCLEDLRLLEIIITRLIADVWLFHWKIVLAIKPIFDWKYTRTSHCFSSYRDK